MTIKYLDSKRLSGSPISDIVQDTASISASSGAGSSLSHNITVANNSNRVLIACISTYGTKPSITGVTWNGSESMTAVPNSEAVDTNNRTQIYYLVNPTSGAHAINATFSASASSSGVAGISLYNVNQTTPVSAGNTNTGNVNNITVNITPTNVGSWIIGHLSSSSGIGSVSNLTEIYSVSAGALIRGGKNTSPVIGSANAIGWGTSSHTWALSGCEILRYGDNKPTNVENNSILVEKDTANRFWYAEKSISSLDSDRWFQNSSINAGGATTITGKVGTYAWSHDGSNDNEKWRTLSDWEFINDDSTDWTISFWYKNQMGTTSNGHVIMSTYSNANNKNGFLIDVRASQGLRVGFQYNNATASFTAFSYNNVITTGTEWVHYSIVYDHSAKTVKVFEGGSALTDDSAGNGANPQTVADHSTQTTEKPLTVGARFDTQYTAFSMDQLLIHKRKLTDSEITGLWASNNGTTTVPTEKLFLHDNFEQTGSTLVNQNTFGGTWTMEPTISNSVYGSSSGWDLSSGTDITLDTVNKGVTLGDVDETNGIGRGLGFTASNDKWILRFKFEISELHGNDHGQATITSDHTVNYNTSSVESLTAMVQGASYWRFVLSKNDQGSYASDISANNTFSLNTTYYIEMIRDGDTVTETIRTGSHSGSVVDTLSVSGLTSGFTLGLDGIQHWSYSSSSEYETGWVRNIEFYNGVTTIN